MRVLAVMAALLALAPPALARAAPIWAVDQAGSKLGFSGVMSGDGFAGVFHRWNAQIAFDPKSLATSKVAVTVDVASAVTGDADRDQALPTGDWFSAATQPRATFVSTAFKDLGAGKYLASGDLTLRGVKRPVTLPFTLAIAGDTAKMNGTVVLDRTAFGIGQGRWKTGDVVATKVTVTIALTAHRGR
jgi:polyisoprenoid-binding protein YceI